ncbi:hypothetical protein MNBD_GAMMA21-706 [hydrothermal vent metagenome]|uniref:Cardiolipin synthase N-terminal domain-containing protein n=1 Tax=hydrothermal vent metagenome TaxID=652676 RepID=A0A3B1AVG6_9ZZZZ
MIRILVIVVVLLWPIVHVLTSSRVHGNAKYTWATIVLLTSWFGYLAFLIKTRRTDDGSE